MPTFQPTFNKFKHAENPKYAQHANGTQWIKLLQIKATASALGKTSLTACVTNSSYRDSLDP